MGAIEALTVVDVNIKSDAIYSGLEKTKWVGRSEIIYDNPIVLIDGAHNIAGIKTLRHTIERFFRGKKKILVLGVLEDKDYEDMLKEIVPIANTIITTAPESPRALPANRLLEAIVDIFCDTVIRRDIKDVNIEERASKDNRIKLYSEQKIDNAIKLANSLADSQDMIIFVGSLYMIGHVRSLLKKE